jgi:5-methylcytosine-specific restriction endonuclease McrBC regulatory subunit McrC
MIAYGDIACFEAGSGDDIPWCGHRMKLSSDLESLNILAKERLIDLTVNGDIVEIRGKDRVGLIILPSGRRLIIRTKIPGLVILQWLVYLKELPDLKVWLQESGVGIGDEFHLCIGRLFLRELDVVTRLHLRKDYMPEVTEASCVRGRVLVKRLADCFHRLPRLPVLHRHRTLDTPYNSVLALALDRLRLFSTDFTPEERSKLARLRDHWASIRRDLTDTVTAVTEAQWACPPGYRNAIQLARLILLGLSLEPASSIGGLAFTMSLARIWERSLRKMFADMKQETGWIPVSDDQRTRRWDDSYVAENPSRWLTTDVMVQRRSERWVLDAKYKRAFGVESRSDRFQMCAYAVAFNAGRATLVYPTASDGEHRITTLLGVAIGGQKILIDSMILPMKSGPQACVNALLQFCKNSGDDDRVDNPIGDLLANSG